jgi:5'-nucleotidase
MTANGPVDLARARVLIANDDGVNAPGLKILEKAMRRLARDVWVVAPEREQSAAGHSLTLRHPLRVRKINRRRFAVDGTPTDSVLLAVHQIMRNTPPDIVLSGINRGGNLGEDVTYSGTVAAAMEGTLLGFPSIALSQVSENGEAVRWAAAEHWLGEVIKRLASYSWPRPVFINVNFPNVPAAAVTGIEVTVQGRRKIGDDLTERTDPRGDTYFWIGVQRTEDLHRKGSDLEAVGRGAISVTPLTVDMTHRSSVKALKTLFR